MKIKSSNEILKELNERGLDSSLAKEYGSFATSINEIPTRCKFIENILEAVEQYQKIHYSISLNSEITKFLEEIDFQLL